jgi:hypothetical protein
MVTSVLQATPDTAEDFDRLLPIHLEVTRNTRQAESLARLTISVGNNKFFGESGAQPTTRVFGFNANGVPTKGPVIVSYVSSQPLGIPLFYIDGVITGNPFNINPNATEVQYVGTQITSSEFLLDIKEPYVRM